MNLNYNYQDPAAKSLLEYLVQTKMPPPLRYHLARYSEYCLVFYESLVDDSERMRWIQDRGGMPIWHPEMNSFGELVIWFPNSRAQHYARITAGDYLIARQESRYCHPRLDHV